MKKVIVLFILCGVVFSSFCQAEIMLAQNGVTSYGIVVPYYADRAVWAVALDMASILEESSDAVFSVYTDAVPATGTEIIVGQANARLAALGLGDFGKDFAGGEYEIRTVDRNILIVGGPLRGDINGMYGFCQDYIGCRWLTPGCQYVPKRAVIAIEAIQDRQKPAFEYRSIDTAMQWDASWYVRNRFNEYKAWVGGPRPAAIMQQEGDLRTFGMANAWNPHVFQDIPESVYEAHPEWRAEVNGQREFIKDPVQRGYCMTHPEFITWIADWTKDKIRQRPQDIFVSITNADNDTICQCSACRLLSEKVGVSGSYVTFVNEVADRVAVEFPNHMLVALSYHHTFAPNPVKVRDSVRIVWAPISADYVCALDQGEVNHPRDYVGQLDRWLQNASSLGIWLYQFSGDNLGPRPSLYGAQRTLSIFREKGVDQVFIEMYFNVCQKKTWGTDGDKSLTAYACAGDYYRPASKYNSMVFPYGFEHLRRYIYARLLWNPDYDVSSGIKEFCDIYYGAAGDAAATFALAAEDVQNYSETVSGQFKPYAGIHMDLSNAPRMKYEVLQEADALFAKALAAVQHDPLYLRRTEMARMSVDIALISHPETDGAVRKAALERFSGLAEEIQLASDIHLTGVGTMNLSRLKEYADTLIK